jgi:hypothetical protein
MMFRATATAPPTQDMPAVADTIPLTVLQLDHPAPAAGWTAYLAGRGVEIVEDDLGREAISRGDAKILLDEQRKREAKRAELLARADEAAEQFDREWRAQLGVGIPASAIPAGMTYAAAVASAELDGVGYRPRATLVADVLDNDAETMMFHPFPADEE